MKKVFDINEFADMARKSNSLIPALGTLAYVYKQQLPQEASIDNCAASCYISGAYCALALAQKLGLLTRKGDALVNDFKEKAFQSLK